MSRSALVSRTIAESDSAAVLRRGLLGLSMLGVLGTMVELAALRHWDGAVQLVPWIVLAVLGAVVVAVALRPSGPVVLVARVIAGAGLVTTLFGVWEHIESNLNSGPLDRVWGERWDALSTVSQWWHAINGDVGPSPLLAPGSIALVCLSLLLATIGLDQRRSAPTR